jgi:hypothetical protein
MLKGVLQITLIANFWSLYHPRFTQIRERVLVILILFFFISYINAWWWLFKQSKSVVQYNNKVVFNRGVLCWRPFLTEIQGYVGSARGT